MITQDELRRIFDYENGNLIWRVRMGQRTKLGQPAGSIGAGGYVCIKILRRSYLAHRLIYLYHYGELPLMLDHKDRNVLNNRIENLRPATGSENQYNSLQESKINSGVKGVLWNKRLQKWQASITVEKNRIHLGVFEDLEVAKQTMFDARIKLHKEFARH